MHSERGQESGRSRWTVEANNLEASMISWTVGFSGHHEKQWRTVGRYMMSLVSQKQI